MMNNLQRSIGTDGITERGKILAFEDALRELPQAELKLVHHFAPGIYARELHIPAGFAATGKIHKTEHLAMLIKGRLAISSEHGSGIFEAPYTFASKPGVKRVAFAMTDCIFTCIHPTHETDLDALEAAFVCDTYEEFEQYRLGQAEKFEVLP